MAYSSKKENHVWHEYCVTITESCTGWTTRTLKLQIQPSAQMVVIQNDCRWAIIILPRPNPAPSALKVISVYFWYFLHRCHLLSGLSAQLCSMCTALCCPDLWSGVRDSWQHRTLLLGVIERGSCVWCVLVFAYIFFTRQRLFWTRPYIRKTEQTALNDFYPHPLYFFFSTEVCGEISVTATWFLGTLSTYTHTSTQMQAQLFLTLAFLTSCPFPSKTSHSSYAWGYPICHSSFFSLCVSIYNPVLSLREGYQDIIPC